MAGSEFVFVFKSNHSNTWLLWRNKPEFNVVTNKVNFIWGCMNRWMGFSTKLSASLCIVLTMAEPCAKLWSTLVCKTLIAVHKRAAVARQTQSPELERMVAETKGGRPGTEALPENKLSSPVTQSFLMVEMFVSASMKIRRETSQKSKNRASTWPSHSISWHLHPPTQKH